MSIDVRRGAAVTALDPAKLTPADAARVLTRAGPNLVDDAMILKDIEDGAPANDDGTLNLVHYSAWLAQQVARQK